MSLDDGTPYTVRLPVGAKPSRARRSTWRGARRGARNGWGRVIAAVGAALLDAHHEEARRQAVNRDAACGAEPAHAASVDSAGAPVGRDPPRSMVVRSDPVGPLVLFSRGYATGLALLIVGAALWMAGNGWGA
jgi:hypothetical protein